MAGFYTAQVAGNPSAIDIALSPTSSMVAVAQAATMLPQESASGYRESLNPSSAPGSKCAFATGGAVVLTVWDALESCPSGYVRKAAKVFAQGDGNFCGPSLIGVCVSNVGFPVLSRPSPESTEGRVHVSASITANFEFGS